MIGAPDLSEGLRVGVIDALRCRRQLVVVAAMLARLSQCQQALRAKIIVDLTWTILMYGQSLGGGEKPSEHKTIFRPLRVPWLANPGSRENTLVFAEKSG